ncbi:MAG TPA: exo-beta-N-acetylmuramidase NamZ domain-containing protein [Caulifigura sp.]|nr:exo-beta-N-acetylmuramidase NamZ domain-containing protein [Caulifigura sp.]
MSIRSIVLLFCLVASVVAEAAPPKLPNVEPRDVGMDAKRLADIDKLVEEGIAKGNMPGAVVIVGRHGGIVFRKAYGQKRIEPDKAPMTVDTVFDMASITKPMATATSILKLIEDGKIGLDDPVAKYIPDFAANGKGVITIRDLLTHQSGLIADNPLKDYEGTPEESFKNISALSFNQPHRTKFNYSDVNFITLGKLVEVVSGQNVNQFARSHFYEPLGMTETGYLPDDDLKKRAAPTSRSEPADAMKTQIQGEVHDPRAQRLGGVAGHAGLFSTAQDIAVYAQMMLNGGEYGGERILKPETVALMTTPNTLPDGRGKRGLGWDMRTAYSINRGDRLSDRAFGHGGFTGTVLWIDPELDLFFIFLSNRVHPAQDPKKAVNALAGQIASVIATAITDVELPAPRVLSGLDVLLRKGFAPLKGRKIGLITNQTGIASDWTDEVKLLHDTKELELKVLFSPEHGFQGKLDQSHIGNTKDEATGLPVFSLYGETRSPTPESLAGLDTIVFDIQDIGARFYTYPSTMANAMQAAAKQGLKFVVLDRPNPINGVDVEGPILDEGKQSFVGFHTLPVRHGMTVGELALMYKEEKGLKVDLEVIKCEGWKRSSYYDATGLPWVNPSPNMRNLSEALLYPGIGMIEYTNVSVGRGTDRPFELLGAPWLDAVKFAAALNAAKLDGVRFVPVKFTPTAAKFPKQECQGVDIIITDRLKLKPVRMGLTIIQILKRDYPNDWKPEGLEKLLLNQAALEALLSGKTPLEVEAANDDAMNSFLRRRQTFLLY